MKKILPKKIALWIVFLAFDFLIAASISEAWISVFIPTANICYDVHDRIGVVFCPNQRTYGYVEKDYSNVFVTNSYGFHDVERKKKKNTYRIHVYGDSMIQNKCVQIEETIPSLLEKYLDSMASRDFEVMNMASGDDSTSNVILTYEEIGKGFEPDLVICYFANDFADNVIEIHGVTYSPYHRIEEDGSLVFIPPIPKDTTTPWEQFKRTCRLYRLASNKFHESKFYHDLKEFKNELQAWIASDTDNGDTSDEQGYSEYRRNICINKSWPLTLRLITHFKEIVEQEGRHFVLVDGLVFNQEQVGTVYSNEDMEAFCMQNGIPYIPVYKKYAELESYGNRSEYFFKDNHLTPLGNELVSLFLAEHLIDHLSAKEII